MNKNPLYLSIAIFFLSGLSQTMNIILIPYLQDNLFLSYATVSLTQVSFFMGYFLLSPLTGYMLRDKDYFIGIKAGLIIGFFGSLGVFISLATINYYFILLSLFVLGSSIAVLQVTANPYTLETSPKEDANSNLCFAQSFTNIGNILAPLLGSLAIFFFVQDFCFIYLIISAAFLSTLLCLHFVTSPLLKSRQTPDSYPAISLGFIAIAVSVGIEVSAASFLIRFFGEKNILGSDSVVGALLTAIFWLGFFLGRSFGSFLLKRARPEKVLLYHSLSGLLFALLVTFSSGSLAAFALLALGFCVSVFFPIIFAITLENSSSNNILTSSILCMGCVGGAVFTFLQGWVADRIGLQSSFAVSSLLFAFIVIYAKSLSAKAVVLKV